MKPVGEGGYNVRVSRTPNRTAVGLVIGAVLVAIVVLTVTSISSASTFYYTVDQFRALRPPARAAFVQVEGDLTPGVRWNPKDVTLRFSLAGKGATSDPLPVVYRGPKPSPFTTGMSVVVAGRLDAAGTFEAQKLMVKCPSKYVAKPAT